MLFLSGLITVNVRGSEDSTRYNPITMADVYVNVTNANGSPAQNVDVYLHFYTYYYTSSVKGKTDTAGKVFLKATPYQIGPCYVTVANLDKSYFVRERLYVEPGRANYKDIVLRPGLPYSYVITGLVINKSSGEPVQKTNVWLDGYDERGREVCLINETAKDGSYLFRVPYSDTPYNVITYFPLKNGMAFSFNVYLNRTIFTYVENIYVRPNPQFRQLSLRFINRTTGEPLAGSSVYASGRATYDDHKSAPFLGSNPTDKNGWINFTSGLGWGEYQVYLQASEYANSIERMFFAQFGLVMNDTDTEVTTYIPIPSKYRNVTFNVTDGETGEPIPDATLSAQTSIKNKPGCDILMVTKSWTNDSGEGTINILPDSDQLVSVSFRDRQPIYIELPGGPVDDNPFYRVSQVLYPEYEYPTGNVSVLVVDERTGLRIPYALVYLSSDDPNSWFYDNMQCDEKGYANMTLPVGNFTIMVDSYLGSGSMEVRIVKDQLTAVTLYLTERRSYPEVQKYEYVLRLVDDLGNVIPDISLRLNSEGGSYEVNADHQGTVRVTALPGIYRVTVPGISSKTKTRPHFAIPTAGSVELPISGGATQAIVLYPTDPLYEITGYVKDLISGAPMQNVQVEAYSYRTLGQGGTNDNPFLTTHEVDLYSQTSFSTTAGYYRNWGRDTVDLRVRSNGYFPEYARIDLSSRSLVQDFYLEPLLPYTTFVNGTLVDHLDNSVAGALYLYDMDRDGYQAMSTNIENDGNFSIPIYPGRFRVVYFNASIREEIELQVPQGGVHNLHLVLTPESTIKGTVTDRTGARLSGINITLMSGDVLKDFDLTNETGHFEFEAAPGDYRLIIGRTDLYDAFDSGTIHASGFNEIISDITLEYRSHGDITGVVSGNLPGKEGPVSGAMVELKDEGNATIAETTTLSDGSYSFVEVEYGRQLYLYVDPPENLTLDRPTYRSGYAPLLFGPFNISSPSNSIDLTLPIAEIVPLGYYNITSYSPTRTEVFLNEPIEITFSASMDISHIQRLLSITPKVRGLEYLWSDGNRTLTVEHNDFDANTPYTVIISKDLLSKEGFRCFSGKDLEWNFTTGSSTIPWGLDEASVIVDDDRTVNVQAKGSRDVKVFIVIASVGSFELGEGPAGTYKATIRGTLFNWSMTYYYHFSDMRNGTDFAPALSGNFTLQRSRCPLSYQWRRSISTMTATGMSVPRVHQG